MKNDIVETTPEDLKLFESEVRKWIAFWGLTEWDVEVSSSEQEYADAYCQSHMNDMTAYIKLSRDLHKDDHDDEFLKLLAFHETCHLITAKLRTLAQVRFINEDQLSHADHEIVSRLINAVYKPSMKDDKSLMIHFEQDKQGEIGECQKSMARSWLNIPEPQKIGENDEKPNA